MIQPELGPGPAGGPVFGQLFPEVAGIAQEAGGYGPAGLEAGAGEVGAGQAEAQAGLQGGVVSRGGEVAGEGPDHVGSLGEPGADLRTGQRQAQDGEDHDRQVLGIVRQAAAV